MTDRYNALTVVLDRDIRSDDAEAILTAIRMIKGVLSVAPHVTDTADYVAEERVRLEYQKKIGAVLWPHP